MKSYKYLYLTIQNSIVRATSTDPEVLQWLVAETQKLIPTVDTRNEETNLVGKWCRIELHKLQRKDREVGWWLFQRLCETGWEPFQYHAVDDNILLCLSVHLRKEVEA